MYQKELDYRIEGKTIYILSETDLIDNNSILKNPEKDTELFVKIEKIVFPDSVKTLRNIRTIVNCGLGNLKSIEFPKDVRIFGGRVMPFISAKSISFPDSIAVIENEGWYGIFEEAGQYGIEEPKIEKIKLPAYMTVLSSYIFSNCKKLKEVILPKHLIEIGDWAFQNCVSLANIDIPEGVIVIREGAFAYCESLKNIKIPDTVTKLEEDVFYRDDKLTVTYYGKNLPAYILNDKTENNKILSFLRTPDYSELHNIKSMDAKIVLAFNVKDTDKKFTQYLNKQAVKLIEFTAVNENMEMLDYILENKIISPKMCDKCIDFARENKFHEIFTMLLDYKDSIGGYKKNDNEKRFDL